jgi:hypothetical protein
MWRWPDLSMRPRPEAGTPGQVSGQRDQGRGHEGRGDRDEAGRVHTIANGSRAAITIAVAALPSRQLRSLTRLDIRPRSLRAAGCRLACVGG